MVSLPDGEKKVENMTTHFETNTRTWRRAGQTIAVPYIIPIIKYVKIRIFFPKRIIRLIRTEQLWDRQTDGQTDTARRHRPRLCIAYRAAKIVET